MRVSLRSDSALRSFILRPQKRLAPIKISPPLQHLHPPFAELFPVTNQLNQAH